MKGRKDHADLEGLHRDNRLSIFFGPIKLLIPIIAYFIIYPLILSKSNVHVLGLWSILMSTVSLLSITDIGFSQLLVRNAGMDKPYPVLNLYRDYLSAQLLYKIFFVILLLLFVFFGDQVLAPLDGTYSISALKLAIPVIFAGALIQLTANLDASILKARHDNNFVQVINALVPISTYIPMIVGAFISKPIEGLAIGVFMNGIINLLIFRYRITFRKKIYLDLSCSLKDVFSNIYSLCERGWYLFSVSLGLLVRAPMYRFLIAYTLGLPAVAVFDLAMRVTQTTREAVAGGFGVLYPSFAILFRRHQKIALIRIIKVSLILLISTGAFLFGLMIAFIEPFLSFWLGSYPADLKPAIFILSIWQMITLLNVPFWHLLLASKNEKIASLSIWVHTLLLLAIIPVSAFFRVDLIGLITYWTVTSLVTQFLIYYFIEHEFNMLWVTLRTFRIRSVAVLAVLFMVCCYHLQSIALSSTKHLLFVGFLSSLYMVVIITVAWKPVFSYFVKKV